MNRYTFVIHVHADGPSTLENLSTHERVPVPDLAAVGPQIERWLAALSVSSDAAASPSDVGDGPPGARDGDDRGLRSPPKLRRSERLIAGGQARYLG
jgi:hypothetical protein